MKKMAEMQMSVVVDPRSKHAIDKQIGQWDENLEKLYVEQYRLRCYTCSLQGTELPNPKVSVTTKFILLLRQNPLGPELNGAPKQRY